MKKLITLFAAALLSASAMAGDDKYEDRSSASMDKADVEEKFSALDRNDDEQISRAEASEDEEGMLSERFASVDADSDGYLTKDEYSARPSDEQFE